MRDGGSGVNLDCEPPFQYVEYERFLRCQSAEWSLRYEELCSDGDKVVQREEIVVSGVIYTVEFDCTKVVPSQSRREFSDEVKQ